MATVVGHRLNDCPMCGAFTRRAFCCGIDLNARRPWRMTPARVRAVHVVARSRKGLTEDEYRLRLGAVGVTTSLALTREQFRALMEGLRRLPDVGQCAIPSPHRG